MEERQTNNKKKLVKIFELNNGEWKEHFLGEFFHTIENNTINIIVTNSKIEKPFKIEMEVGDCYEKQNEKVVQVQGNNFDGEYALSFIDKDLCKNLCDDFDTLHISQCNSESTLEFTESNFKKLKECAIRAMSERKPSELFKKISQKDIANGFIQVANSLKEMPDYKTLDLFIFSRALLYLQDDELWKCLLTMEVLPSLFEVFSYDPQLPEKVRVNFRLQFEEHLKNMKEIFTSEKLSNYTKFSFALVYFRDVVIARFCDDNIIDMIKNQLENLHKSILIESIHSKVFETCCEMFSTSDEETQHGICLTIMKLCEYLLLFQRIESEKYFKSMMDQGILKLLENGLKTREKSFCLDAINFLFDCGSGVGSLLIKNKFLETISYTIIKSNSSLFIGGFSLLSKVANVADGNKNYEREVITTIIPGVMNILIEPICDQEKYVNIKINSYISQLTPFIFKISQSDTAQVKPFIIQCGILSKLIRLIPDVSSVAKTSILQMMRDIIKSDNKELNKDYITVILDSNLVEILKKLLTENKLGGCSTQIAESIINSFKNRMSICDTEIEAELKSQSKEQTSGLDDFKNLQPIKREVNEEETLRMMERDSPSKKYPIDMNRINIAPFNIESVKAETTDEKKTMQTD